jgi:predicted GIY-YIG superfamily endonuclease
VSRPSLRQMQTVFLLGRPYLDGGCEKETHSDDTKIDSGPGVYVLQKDDGTFYVGKSGNIAERLRQHANGTGASCAKGNVRRVNTMTPPISEDLEAWERAETLTRMRQYGISRVRGWMYTTPDLSESQREHAFQQVCEKHDLCRKCGNCGHFAVRCRVAISVATRPTWAH